MIFSSPENCSDAACADYDIFIDQGDHSAGFNAPQIAADPRVDGLGAPERWPTRPDA